MLNFPSQFIIINRLIDFLVAVVINISFFIFGIIILLFSMVISYSTVPYINKFARYKNFMDNPDKRKMHKEPIVRIGGISIFLGFILSFFLFYLSCNFYNPFYEYLYTYSNVKLIVPFLICSAGFFLIGLVDDLYSLSPFLRLLLQFLVATILWKFGLRIENFLFLSSILDNSIINLENTFSLLFTIFWVVGVTNAINWIDGLDGLAAGFSLIASIGFIYVCFSNQNFLIGYFSICLAGSSLGFLFRNFYPATIIMGDSGSYFLGIQLSSLSLLATESPSLSFGYNQVNFVNFLFGFLFLMIPLLDMLYVICCRIIKGVSPFYGDKSHLHHRLLFLGYSHKEVVKIIMFLSIISVLIASYVSLIFKLS